MPKKPMTKAAAEARREYFREWRKKNSDKVRKYNADYWRRQAEKKLAEEANENGTADHDDGA